MEDSPQSILDDLNGAQIYIPPLEPMFGHWPLGISPHRKRLESVMDARIDFLCKGKHDITAFKMKACDFALFAAALWPQVPFDRLRTMAFFSLWVIMWDDEIDEATGSLFEQINEADNLRNDTLRYVRQCLRISDKEDRFEPDNFIVSSFDIIGREIAEVYTKDQRQRFLDEIAYFIQTTREEQHARVQKQQLSLEEYNRLRIGTVAAPMLIALNEFATEMILPDELLKHPRMRALSDQTSLVGAYINDILSVEKEVAKDAPCSLIPLLYAPHRNIKRATTEATELLQEVIDSFDSTAEVVCSDIDHDSVSNVNQFVTYCRLMCTGLLYWTLRSKRYGLITKPRDAEGGFYLSLATRRSRSQLSVLGEAISKVGGPLLAGIIPLIFLSVMTINVLVET